MNQQKCHSNAIQLVHQNNKPNLLIGVTGSVATIKLTALFKQLKPHFNIKIIATQNAKKFMFNEENQQKLLQQLKDIIYYDQMQWQIWKKRGDPVLHIQLRKWAHYLLIAPLGANTLAKISNGICDNLLTLVCRAWSMEKKQTQTQQSQSQSKKKVKKLELKNPVIVCPSMNTLMWDHPITLAQLDILKNWGFQVLGPISKKMMCGDIGNGAMSQISDIVKYMVQKIHKK